MVKSRSKISRQPVKKSKKTAARTARGGSRENHSFILLADIGDQRLRTLQLNFEGGNQRVFRVNDYVSRFPLTFKTNRKLHLCALPISVKSSTIQWGV